MEENQINIQGNIIALIDEQSLKFRLEVENKALDEWGIERKEIEDAILKYSNLIRKIKDRIKYLEKEDLNIYDTDSEDVRIAKYEQRAMLSVLKEFLAEEK